MSVLVTITYDVREDLRADYVAWARRMREHLASLPGGRWTSGHGYRFFEDRERENRFTEAFWLDDPNDLYTLEDQDPVLSDLMREVVNFQDDPESVEYRVMLEADEISAPLATA